MAARQVHRRLLFFFSGKQPLASFRSEESWRRGLQTIVGPTNQAIASAEKHETCKSNPTQKNENTVWNPVSDYNSSSITFNAKSNLKVSPRHDTCMIFTCKVCDTRSVKTVARESYEKGVVVARCGGCNNLHLIADHLGMFGNPGSIEEILAARGEEVRKGSMDTLNLTLDDLAGTGNGKEAGCSGTEGSVDVN